VNRFISDDTSGLLKSNSISLKCSYTASSLSNIWSSAKVHNFKVCVNSASRHNLARALPNHSLTFCKPEQAPYLNAGKDIE
jgi:hypothetical protein